MLFIDRLFCCIFSVLTSELLSLFLLSRRLYVFLSMLVNGDEDDKSEDIINKENESISMIVSILETIKLSEDSVDTTKSKVCVQAPT